MTVAITQEEWCWKHKSVEIDILDSDVQGVEFRQTGYLLRCTLSHAITLVRPKNTLTFSQYQVNNDRTDSRMKSAITGLK